MFIPDPASVVSWFWMLFATLESMMFVIAFNCSCVFLSVGNVCLYKATSLSVKTQTSLNIPRATVGIDPII